MTRCLAHVPCDCLHTCLHVPLAHHPWGEPAARLPPARDQQTPAAKLLQIKVSETPTQARSASAHEIKGWGYCRRHCKTATFLASIHNQLLINVQLGLSVTQA